MNILVCAAHPDDECLGCGATIAKLAKEWAEDGPEFTKEHSITIAIFGQGGTDRPDARRYVEMLQRQAEAAAEVLGAKVSFHDLPDNQFDTVPLLSIIQRVEMEIRRVQPEVIYSHHPSCLNIDHRWLFEAVLTATRPMPGCHVRELLAFEVPSSTEWAFRLGDGFRPNVFVDVTDTIETKIAAMQCYTGEVRPPPHPRSAEVLRAIARRWGSVCGCEYAEAFELIRCIERS